MTEAEWLACADPAAMLKFLSGKSSNRKLRLFAVLCCRRISNLLDTRGLTALDIAEQFADGLACEEQLQEAERMAEDAFNEFYGDQEYAAETVVSACDLDALESASRAAWFVSQLVDVGVPRPLIKATRRLTQRQQCRWLRDMLTPFRPSSPVCFAVLAWNDGTVRRIAEGIYEGRAFDRLPILADALLDAGCDNDDLIQHCRSDGPHVRGCWAVDLILGKQ
jgi:hypothetical protein